MWETLGGRNDFSENGQVSTYGLTIGIPSKGIPIGMGAGVSSTTHFTKLY